MAGAWDELQRLSDEVSAVWKSDKSGLEILMEDRGKMEQEDLIRSRELPNYVDVGLSFSGLEKQFRIHKARLILATCIFKFGFWVAGLSSTVKLD